MRPSSYRGAASEIILGSTPVMSLVKKNIVANFAGSVWRALMELIFIPLYIKFMGIESWGLVGFFATLLIVFGLLDMGLSATLNREMARLSVIPHKEQEMRNLVRTLEAFYWGIAVFIGIAIVLISPFLARHWIKAGELSSQVVEQAFCIMGWVIALQMPVGFYSGGLMGLQKHVLLNVINGGMSLLRGGGAVLILWLISPTIQAFLSWQVLISMVNTVFLALFLWRALPPYEKRAVFQIQLLKGIWRFAVGMSGISALAVILTQMDKIILSRMLSLEMFGYYTLASMVAMSLKCFFTPVFYSMYPRFTQLVSMGDEERLKRFYHEGCQFMSVLILPIASVVALFSYEILLLWTHNPKMAEESHFLVSILICGTAINGLMNLPYALQLASGWTKLSVVKNIIAVILFVPATIFMTTHFGATGAACVWLSLNAAYIVFEIPVMHLRLLRKEKWRWYWQDVCLPLIPCTLIAGIGKIFMGTMTSSIMVFIYVLNIFIIISAAAVLTTPMTRLWLLSQSVAFKLSRK
jgi:O-antigen/teichoic acid export membrane protein